jgi:hypothetical protein
MLLRFDPGPACHSFAERQKFPDFVSKCRKGAVVGQRDLRHQSFVCKSCGRVRIARRIHRAVFRGGVSCIFRRPYP